MEKLKRGDAEAFDSVYEAYRPRIHGFLLRLARDRVLADDLAQDTWMAFAGSAATLRDDSDLAAVLFTIARNEWRSHRRWALLDLVRVVAYAAQPPRDAIDPEGYAGATESGARLERALGEIEPHHREVLLLVGVEGFEQDRAAAILGVPYATLRKRLARARSALTERMSVLEAEPRTGLARVQR